MTYAEKHFEVEVSQRGTGEGEDDVCIAVTTNGVQWWNISFPPSKLGDVISVLEEAQDAISNGNPLPRHFIR